MPTFYFGVMAVLHSSIEGRIETIAKAAADSREMEFVHFEAAGTKRNPIFRFFIDKPDGVTIEDCTDVSRAIETELDRDDFIPGAYVLEVSSPGLDRHLYSFKDFQRFTGSLAKVKLKKEFDGPTALNGRIVSAGDGVIEFDDRTAGTVKFKFEDVLRANLKIDLQEELKRG